MVRNRDQHGVDLHDDLDPASLIDFAAALASMAKADLPTKRRYAGRESPDAIARIVYALHVGRADWAPLGQNIIKVSRSGKFFDLAKIIWAAVLGEASKASPARSIQAYIRREREREREQACMNGAAERRGAAFAP